MNFLITIKNSIYNPNFYRNIPKTPLSAAIGYYLLLSLIATLLHVAFLTFPLISGVNSMTQTLSQEAVKAFPADLTIQLQNGQASINKPQPYIIPLCDDQNSCQNIIIDTRGEETNNYFNKQDTFIVLTKNAIFAKDNNGQIRGYTLDKFHNFTLNRATIAYAIQKISPWFPFVTPILIVFIGVGFYILSLLKLIYFLLVALLFWLLSKRFFPQSSFGTGYKFVLYSITLGTLASVFFDATSWLLHFYAFPFMTTFLAVIVFLCNMLMTPTIKIPSLKSPRKPRASRKKK